MTKRRRFTGILLVLTPLIILLFGALLTLLLGSLGMDIHFEPKIPFSIAGVINVPLLIMCVGIPIFVACVTSGIKLLKNP